eukprot:4833318-Prymnesium_polylepis.2
MTPYFLRSAKKENQIGIVVFLIGMVAFANAMVLWTIIVCFNMIKDSNDADYPEDYPYAFIAGNVLSCLIQAPWWHNTLNAFAKMHKTHAKFTGPERRAFANK